MRQRIKRIDVVQTAKVFGLFYLLMGLVGAAFLLVFGSLMPTGGMDGAGMMFGTGVILVMPFFYALLGIIFGAIAAWFYNLVAGWTGGLELDLEPSVV